MHKKPHKWYNLCVHMRYLIKLSSKWSKIVSNRPGGGDIVDEYNKKINKALKLPPMDGKNPFRWL